MAMPIKLYTPYVPYKPESIDKQARALSSGTLAGLTGFRTYSEIDPIQAEFVEFCEENINRYSSWAEAWKHYWALKIVEKGWEDASKKEDS